MVNLISVIIPIYNVEKYVERCLLSIINQTYKNLEIICVNDCTQDNSMVIVKDFAKHDTRIKIIERNKNGGLSAARNSGLEMATGEFVYFLDSDDWIDNDYLEKSIQKIVEYKADIVLNTNIKNEYENSPADDFIWNQYNKILPDGEFLSVEDAVNNTHCMVWCHLYRRSLLINNNLFFPVNYINEDNYYNHITKINADKIFAFYGSAYHYFRRKSSIMGKLQKVERDLSYLKIIKLICEYNQNHKELNKYKIKIINANIFSVINSEEMFEVAKFICEFIIESLDNVKSLYNELDCFYIQKILEVSNFAELKIKYPKGLRTAFLINYIRTKHFHPKISVIVPVYNSAKFIEKTLNSITKQTFKSFEVICINDRSTDNSLQILEEFAQKNNKIKIINNKNNIGAARTRNIGINIANGDYIYFLDSDDYIDEKYLECMVQKIENEKCDIVLNMSIFAENNGKISRFHHPSLPTLNAGGEFLDTITTIHDAPCFIWARMYRKSFLDKNSIRFLDTHADDVVFNTISSIYTDKTFVFYGENYHYVIHNEGMTGQANASNNKDLNHIKAHSLIYDYLKEHNKLDDKLKLFRVYPFIKVDTKEKFDFYKMFFKKIEEDFYKNENIYNEMEKYFANSLLKSSNYEEYLLKYNKVVTIGFLRQKK